MPPLYRMPVFYLAVLALTTLAGLGTRLSDRPTSAPVSATPAAPPPASATAVPAAEPPVALPPVAVSDGILRTPEGLRRKVVVKDLDVVCWSEPDRLLGRPVGRPLDYFAIRFVSAESP